MITDLKSTNQKNEDRLKKTQIQNKQLLSEKDKIQNDNAQLRTEKAKLKQELQKSQDTVVTLRKSMDSNHRRKVSMQSHTLEKNVNSNQVNSVRTQQRKQVASNKKNGQDSEVPASMKAAGTGRVDLDKSVNKEEAENKCAVQVPPR